MPDDLGPSPLPAGPERDPATLRALQAELAEARLALYRPGADDAARKRHALLASGLARQQARTGVAIEGVTRRDGRGEGERRRRRIALLVATGGVVVGLGALGTLRGAEAPTPRPSVEASAPIARLLAADPDRLPEAWRHAAVIASSDDLDGAVPLRAPATRGPTRLLLVVRCPAPDRSFQAVVGTAAPRYGACGRLQVLELPDGTAGPTEVVVTGRGPLPFSAALLARRT